MSVPKEKRKSVIATITDIKTANLQFKLESLEAKNKELQSELDKHRWIPVAERLPEKGGLYYTFARYTSMPLAVMFHIKDKKWNHPQPSIRKITHWKPIILPVSKEVKK